MSFKLDPSRYLMLFVVALLQLVTSLAYFMYAPVTDDTADFFGASNGTVNYLTVMFFALYVVFAPISAYLLGKRGLRFNLVLVCDFIRIIFGTQKHTIARPLPSMLLAA